MLLGGSPDKRRRSRKSACGAEVVSWTLVGSCETILCSREEGPERAIVLPISKAPQRSTQRKVLAADAGLPVRPTSYGAADGRRCAAEVPHRGMLRVLEDNPKPVLSPKEGAAARSTAQGAGRRCV